MPRYILFNKGLTTVIPKSARVMKVKGGVRVIKGKRKGVILRKGKVVRGKSREAVIDRIAIKEID